MKKRKEEDSSLYKGCKLFLSKNWFEVVKIDCDMANILPFRVDILLSSKSIWFSAKTTRMEPDNKIKLREILELLYLSLSQHLSSRKILKVLMIHNNIDEIS